jgi:uncharacterized RDD family membrane protein YckC
MKCPKCGYLGFEQVDRCRNCGYEFSLATSASTPDLALNQQAAEEGDALHDFSFLKESSRTAESVPTPSDLPLFEPPAVDDAPLITKASPPRTPLAVRRATPEMPRVGAEPRAQSFDGFEPESASTPTARTIISTPPGSRRRLVSAKPAAEEPRAQDAGLVARGLAAAVDVIILIVVDISVVYFTMQICGITVLELSILPKAPLLAFFVVQNGGYFVAFTAGGQTLGKMLAGIRVVTVDEAEQLGVGRAGLRTLMWALLAIPAGLGFVTALFRADHRGLHDRFAGTRVVRASS